MRRHRRDGTLWRDGKQADPRQVLAHKGDYMVCRFCFKPALRVLENLTGATPVNVFRHFEYLDGRGVLPTDPMACPNCKMESSTPNIFIFYGVKKACEVEGKESKE